MYFICFFACIKYKYLTLQVINFDFPFNLCAYSTRIGRTPRGKAYTFIEADMIQRRPKREYDNILQILSVSILYLL